MGEGGNTRAESHKTQGYSLMNHHQWHVCGTPSQKTRTLPAVKKPPSYFFPVVKRPLSSHLPKDNHCHLPQSFPCFSYNVTIPRCIPKQSDFLLLIFELDINESVPFGVLWGLASFLAHCL